MAIAFGFCDLLMRAVLEDQANVLADRARERVRSGVGLPFFDWYPIDGRPLDWWYKYIGARAPKDYLEKQREGFAAELTPDQSAPITASHRHCGN